jgi:hypothetical protein
MKMKIGETVHCGPTMTASEGHKDRWRCAIDENEMHTAGWAFGNTPAEAEARARVFVEAMIAEPSLEAYPGATCDALRDCHAELAASESRCDALALALRGLEAGIRLWTSRGVSDADMKQARAALAAYDAAQAIEV